MKKLKVYFGTLLMGLIHLTNGPLKDNDNIRFTIGSINGFHYPKTCSILYNSSLTDKYAYLICMETKYNSLDSIKEDSKTNPTFELLNLFFMRIEIEQNLIRILVNQSLVEYSSLDSLKKDMKIFPIKTNYAISLESKEEDFQRIMPPYEKEERNDHLTYTLDYKVDFLHFEFKLNFGSKDQGIEIETVNNAESSEMVDINISYEYEVKGLNNKNTKEEFNIRNFSDIGLVIELYSKIQDFNENNVIDSNIFKKLDKNKKKKIIETIKRDFQVSDEFFCEKEVTSLYKENQKRFSLGNMFCGGRRKRQLGDEEEEEE